jgi:hypothetical protein
MKLACKNNLIIIIIVVGKRLGHGLDDRGPPILAVSLEIKWQGREADQSSPSSADVKNEWISIFSPTRLHDVVLN